MFCINCFHHSTSVKNSRPHKKQPTVWRRRHCRVCGATFTTLEAPSLTDTLEVYSLNGGKQYFNSGRLIISIAAAFTHRPDEGKMDALWLSRQVETFLATQKRTSVSAEDLAAVVHATLRRYDEIAAMQYAVRHKLVTSIRKRRGRPSLHEHERPTDE